MCEPVLSAQPLTEQNAVQVDGDGTQAVPGVDLGMVVYPSPDGHGGPHPDRPHEDGDQSLRTELSQLRRAMETRPTIDQACGVLMATFGLNAQTAWNALVATSQNTNTKLHRLAEDLWARSRETRCPRSYRSS